VALKGCARVVRPDWCARVPRAGTPRSFYVLTDARETRAHQSGRTTRAHHLFLSAAISCEHDLQPPQHCGLTRFFCFC
jgi:hypothetical protein